MAQNFTKKTSDSIVKKFNFNNQSKNHKNVYATNLDHADSDDVREQDFMELHTLFEIEYEQFLTETSKEITEIKQKLSNLNSIIYGN